MVAPPLAAVSSGQPPSYTAVVKHTMEEVLSTPSELCFPNEFPYEYDSSTFSTSQGGSTETEDETSDEEDDFLAGLNRRLAFSTQRLSSSSLVTDDKLKPQVTKSSAQSEIGSPNGPFSQVPSPSTSPFREEDSLKVLSAAAGEVAKIKTANFDAKPISRRPKTNPNSFIPFQQNAAFYYWLWQPQYQLQLQSPRAVPTASAWLPSSSPVSGNFVTPNAVKSPSAGTGVFLPRNYSSTPSDSLKKSESGCAKKVVQQQNPKIEELTGRCQPNSKACLSSGRTVVAGGCGQKQKKKTSYTRLSLN